MLLNMYRVSGIRKKGGNAAGCVASCMIPVGIR